MRRKGLVLAALSLAAFVISVAASLYSNRLTATLPHGLPSSVVSASKGSIGGAIVAAQRSGHSDLADIAVRAFLHSFAGGCFVAVRVTAVGALVAVLLLPSRPAVPSASAPTTPEVPHATVS